MTVSLLTAFTAGLLSFLSPCVLPLVPAYLSFLSGASIQDLRSGAVSVSLWSPGFRRALGFVAGFSLVFVALGASATWLGRWLLERLPVLTNVAGVAVIIVGLHLTGLVRIPFLYRERRWQVQSQRAGVGTAFLIGLAFAFGWTPCIGPILAGILAYAGAQETVGQGIRLLAIYSLGLAVPFLATALAVDRALGWLERFKRYLHAVEIASGLLLIAVGVLLLAGGFARLAGYFGFAQRFAL
jgi:cytochrome c-type biogenesis protein